jgi:hypothetical protein
VGADAAGPSIQLQQQQQQEEDGAGSSRNGQQQQQGQATAAAAASRAVGSVTRSISSDPDYEVPQGKRLALRVLCCCCCCCNTDVPFACCVSCLSVRSTVWRYARTPLFATTHSTPPTTYVVLAPSALCSSRASLPCGQAFKLSYH